MTIEKTTLIVDNMQRMATLLESGEYPEWSSSIFKLAKNMSLIVMTPNTFF